MKKVKAAVAIMNVLFILWVLYNAVDSGWRGTVPEKGSFIVLAVLLLANSYLLFRRNGIPK